jgi:predicted house-cleaning NTP pyrophosphatase (Maf/HAM1 superfamily)
MRDYSDAEMDKYIATGDAMDKAAAYGVQNRTFQLVARVEGCFANVMGLPICRVYHTLAERIEMPEPAIECHLHPEENCSVERVVVSH